MMLEDNSSRTIHNYLAEKGYNICFTNIARYKRESLPQKIEIGRKLQQLNAVQNPENAQTLSLASATNAVQAADPLLQRINRKYERYENLASSAAEVLDYQGFAAVDRAETQTMRLHAELTGRLTQAQSTTLVQVVIGADAQPRTESHSSAADAVIDIAPVRE
jgi:hypothetical protein